jgi:hypothetical protein
MQAMTTVVGWSVNGALTAQLAQPLSIGSLLLVRAASISPTIAMAANSVVNSVFMGALLAVVVIKPYATVSTRVRDG